jgi:hypothetical protein
MMKRILSAMIFLLLIASMGLHFWEIRKIREFSETFTVQAAIEVKRTSLMVVYQEVLKNMAKDIEELRKRDNESLELKWEAEAK